MDAAFIALGSKWRFFNREFYLKDAFNCHWSHTLSARRTFGKSAPKLQRKLIARWARTSDTNHNLRALKFDFTPISVYKERERGPKSFSPIVVTLGEMSNVGDRLRCKTTHEINKMNRNALMQILEEVEVERRKWKMCPWKPWVVVHAIDYSSKDRKLTLNMIGNLWTQWRLEMSQNMRNLQHQYKKYSERLVVLIRQKITFESTLRRYTDMDADGSMKDRKLMNK